MGGSGQGEQLAANKVRGVRAALCNDLYTARMARQHNDANVLSIGARDQTRQMGRVIQEVRTNLVGDFFEGRRINSTRVTSCSSNDHARTMFKRKIAHLIHVNSFVTWRRFVGLKVVQLATGVDR